MRKRVIIILAAALLSGCASVSEHWHKVGDATPRKQPATVARGDAKTFRLTAVFLPQALIIRTNHRELQQRPLRRQLRESAAARQRIQNDERKRLAALESDAQNWRRAQVIRDYIDALECKSLSATHGIEHMSYFQWARTKADWLDPLIRNVTDILDEDIKIPY